ncbi:MAG TPA: hypothetical protein VLK23_04085 [Thermodesulfobacteriota bacterium]|nr:hypothetical protein [Thermodesulfobacteriota bacterium]
MEIRKGIETAQEKLEWAIKEMGGRINCKIINYQDEKYLVQFFLEMGNLISVKKINTCPIPEEWIEDTNPEKRGIHPKLRALLKKFVKKT